MFAVDAEDRPRHSRSGAANGQQTVPEDALAIQAMSWRELQVLAMRLTEDLPKGDPAFVAIDGSTARRLDDSTTKTEPPRTLD